MPVRMRAVLWFCLGALRASGQDASPRMESREEAPQTGLFLVSEAPIPNPGGFPDLRMVEPGAEASWEVPVREGAPYLIEARVSTRAALSGGANFEAPAIYYGRTVPLWIPDTGGVERRVGLFFRAPASATSARIQFGPRGRANGIPRDLRVREATEAEAAAAYDRWRAQFPPRDLSPRPGDGRHLSHFTAQLTEPIAPREPLRIVGIGSSYTNLLGNGERLIRWIQERFPDAPPVIYEKHVGSAVEYDFTRGWMRQHVLGRRPDLVILYSGGKAADLEKLLADFRAHSTADVMVASLHLRAQDGEISEATVETPEWRAIREVALKYGCEWVDNRREWADYLLAKGKEIPWLLKDPVHQNDHGALVINENLCRHLVASPGAPVDRRIRVIRPGENADGESVIGSLGSGGRVRVTFRGHRIDLIGRRSARGGRIPAGNLMLDGRALDEVPAFLTTVIQPGAGNHRPERGSAADRSPHLVRLGDPETLVPQRWTIRMIGDAGAYELIGSVTGHDGFGHNGGDFTGRSGQITVPTALWRRRFEADGVTYSNRDGDTFTWEVHRATASAVEFRGGPPGEVFTLTLADQLASGSHTLEIGPVSGGEAELIGFRIHEPLRGPR